VGRNGGASAIKTLPPPLAERIRSPARGGRRGAKKTYTRDESRKLVMGKAPEDLYTLIGRPDRSSRERDRRVVDNSDPYSYAFLHYSALVIDPYTRKAENVRLQMGDKEYENGKLKKDE
jgi:hypothetical protein